MARQASREEKIKSEIISKKPPFDLIFLILQMNAAPVSEPRCGARSLWKLFILGVPSLWRSERRQLHSSSSACR